MIDVNKIYHGYSPQCLKALPDKSIHCVVTSPPYWAARVYEGVEPQIWDDGTTSCLGLEESPYQYAMHIVEIFREVKRVLRDDGTVWLNIGDSYCSSTRGSGGHNPKQDSNRGSFFEDLKFSIPRGLKAKDLSGVPWRSVFGLQEDGWYLRSDIIWAKPSPMPEPVTDRPTRSHEYIFLLSKSETYYYDNVAIMEPIKEIDHKSKFGGSKYPGSDGIKNTFSGREYDSNGMMGKNKRSVWIVNTDKSSEAHFATFPPLLIEPCILAGTSEAGCCSKCGTPLERIIERQGGPPEGDHRKQELKECKTAHETGTVAGSALSDIYRQYGYPSKRTVGWKANCNCESEIAPCIVLDPFAGSGTTIETAMRLGRYAVGFDASPVYVKEIAQLKIERAKTGISLSEQRAGQKTLFD